MSKIFPLLFLLLFIACNKDKNESAATDGAKNNALPPEKVPDDFVSQCLMRDKLNQNMQEYIDQMLKIANSNDCHKAKTILDKMIPYLNAFDSENNGDLSQGSNSGFESLENTSHIEHLKFLRLMDNLRGKSESVVSTENNANFFEDLENLEMEHENFHPMQDSQQWKNFEKETQKLSSKSNSIRLN